MANGTYRYTFNANGGSGAPSSISGITLEQDGLYLATVTLPSGKPSRTYYTFLGWSTSSTSTSAQYSAGGKIYLVANTATYTRTLYAVWKAETATVTYNANGGTGAPSSQTVNKNEWFNLRTGVPTRQYYRFLGWATSSTATVAQYQPGGQARIVGNLALYAVWEKLGDVVSTSNGTIGSPMTLTINKVSSSYTDEITFQFGNTTGTIASGTTATSISWTPPLSLASEIPNASSGTLVITCATYNGSSLVGTTTTSVSLTVPQSLAPTASVSFADTDATCLAWGIFVQSRSKLAFTVTASGQYGATITAYSAQVNGSNYTSATWTTDVLLYSGTNTYTVKVTDSRGYQTTVTGSFTVESYSTPSVSLVSCDRNDSNPDQVDIVFDFAVASVQNNNTALYSFDYKEKSASNWTRGSDESLGAYSGTISDFLSSIDQGSEYDIRINVKDAFQTVSTETEVGVSGNVLFNQRHRGGLGLLMKSQSEDQLDVGKQSVFHGKVKEMFGSTVGTHSASGNYAKILSFGTDVQVGKNLLNDVNPDVKNAYLTGAYKLGASANDRVVIIPINPNTDYTFTWNRVAIEGASSDDTNVLLFSEYPVVSTTVGTSTGVNMGYSPAIRTFNSGSNIYCAIKIANVTKTQYQDTLSASQLELGTSSTAHEPYTDASDLNINSPITLEYIKTGDSAPTRLTIAFNRDFSLASFTKDASADAYLVNSATATWDLYIGKNNTSDKVEIIDFHDPWSNTDLTVDWEETSVSTLPTGAIDATPANTVLSIAPSGVSVANASWETTAEITLGRGIWILSGYIQFNSNATGIRSAVLSASQDSGTSTRNMSSDTSPAMTSGNSTKLHFVDVYQIASETTYYLNAYQNCGSALTIYGRLTAIKIV